MTDEHETEEWWNALLTGDDLKMPMRQARHLFGRLPAEHRCKFCNSPFDGFAAPAMRMMNRGPSRLTTEFCNKCQATASQHVGGAEIELTLLFADVRGSTQMAEEMGTVEFSRLISRFFGVSSKVLLRSHAWVYRLVGDQVIGMYIPFYAGENHGRAAISAARDLLARTGHGDEDGPWIQLGVGIHGGTAFVGLVGAEDSATDITVLGDVPNVAARLSSAGKSGEILISEETFDKAGIEADLETQTLELKGKSEPMSVRVLRDYESSIWP